MNETLKLKEQKVTINPELDKYNAIVSSPKKLARANEMFAKWGLPKELEEIMLEELSLPEAVYNPALDKYEGQVLFPKKLAEAEETLAKYPLPEEWADAIYKKKCENTFWIKGMLSQADISTQSFLIVVEATDNQPQTTYTITALSDILNKLVKEYWGLVVNVHIKPKKEKEIPCQYELIAVA